MRANNFALRLPESLFANLREAAAQDGVAMNQYVAIALAEKLATRKTARQFLAERAERGNVDRALGVLERAGNDEAESAAVSYTHLDVYKRQGSGS